MAEASPVKLPSDECHWPLLNISQHRLRITAWWHQATSDYLSQCWPRSMLPSGATRSQWSNSAETWIGIYFYENIIYFLMSKLNAELNKTNRKLNWHQSHSVLHHGFNDDAMDISIAITLNIILYSQDSPNINITTCFFLVIWCQGIWCLPDRLSFLDITVYQWHCT